VLRQPTNNASIRGRFGIEPANKAVASRLLREAVEAGMIRLENEGVADKLRAYVPFWA
jgi:ATP-dependent DNA helicase RecG